jgi:hypothetical protein
LPQNLFITETIVLGQSKSSVNSLDVGSGVFHAISAMCNLCL